MSVAMCGGSLERRDPCALEASIAVDQVQRVSVPDDVDTMVVLHEHDALRVLGAFAGAISIVEHGVHPVDTDRIGQFARLSLQNVCVHVMFLHEAGDYR